MKIKRLLNNKKADLPSLLIIGVVIFFGFSIIAVFFAHVFNDAINELKDSGQFSNNTVQIMDKVQTQTIPLLDFMMMFMFFASIIGLIISSVFIRTSPVIMGVFIILLIIVIILAAQFSNIYDDIRQTEEISSTASQFSKTNIILGQYFPLLIFFAGIIVIVILYSKSRYPGEV